MSFWRNFRYPILETLAILVIFLAISQINFSWSAWESEICRLRNCYCEPFQDGGLFLQPLTALSNLGYILAGLFILQSSNQQTVPSDVIQNSSQFKPVFQRVFGAAVLLAGLFSTFSHASLTRIGEWFDLMGVYGALGFTVWYALIRLMSASLKMFAWGYLLTLAILGFLMATNPHLQQVWIGILLVISTICELTFRSLKRPFMDNRYLIGALVCFISGGVIWMGFGRAPDCPPGVSFPWHVLWHLLSAAALGLLFPYYLSEYRKTE